MRKRSISKFLAMLLLLAQLFSLTAGITVFAADSSNETPRDNVTDDANNIYGDDTPDTVAPPKAYGILNGSRSEEPISMGGYNYTDAIVFSMGYNSGGGNAEVNYNFEGKYTSLTFQAGYMKGSAQNVSISVSADGETVLEDSLKASDIPKTFQIDLKGVHRLSIHLYNGAYDTTYYAVAGLAATPVEGEDLTRTYKESDPFFHVPCYQTNGAELITDEFDMSGFTYKGGYAFRTGYILGHNKSVSFNFKKQYKSMEFDIGRYLGRSGGTAPGYITVKLDGEPHPDYNGRELLWNELALHVKLDLTGVSQVTIVVDTNGYDTAENRIGDIRLVSDGVPRGIALDASPVSGTDDYTLTLNDETPEFALNPRVYPSDAPREYNMTAEENPYFTVSEDGVVTARHAGSGSIVFTLPDDPSVSVECAVTSKITAHVWNEGEVTKEPTWEAEGEKLFTCTVCEETKTEKLEKLAECEEHTWNEGEVTKEPTYTEEGEKLLTCTVCGKTETAVVEKLVCTEHAWNEGEVTKEPTYTEAGEKKLTCTICGETKTEVMGMLSCTEHNWDEGVVTKDPAATEAGEKTFTCQNCGETKTEPIAPTNKCGENLFWKVEDGVLIIFTNEGDSMMDAYGKGDAPWYELRDEIHAIKMEKGIVIGDNAFYNLDKVTRVELPIGLTYFQNAFVGCTSLEEFSFPEGNLNGFSTTPDGTMVLRHAKYDDVDSMVVYACAPTVSGTVSVPAGYDTIHFGAFEGCGMTDIIFPTSVQLILPGAFKNCPNLKTYHYSGTADQWAEVIVDSDEPNGGNDSLNAAELHLQVFVPEQAVTCTEAGHDAHYVCETCQTYYDDEDPGIVLDAAPVKEAAGHSWDDGVVTKEPTYTEAGEKTFTCASCGETEIKPVSSKECTEHNWDDGVITKEPTYTEAGETTFTCQNCGETKTEPADMLVCTEHEWDSGKVIKEATTDAEGEKEFTCLNCGETKTESIPKLENPFKDIEEDEYFFVPVLWAVQQGITGGIGEGQFGPHNSCTRGQVVTFLWRAAGSPEPKTLINPFSDVAETDYFYTPVLWAVEKGITGGTGPDTFSPDATCTRGQVVTFLWRAAGSPETDTLINPFVDVFSTDYYFTPVLWAVANGITGGIGEGLFGPNNTCTRAQVVTFLYKASQVDTEPDTKPEPTTALVTDVFSDTVTDKTKTYCYHIPKINLDGDLAQELNKDIYDTYYKLVEEQVYESVEQGDPIYCTSMDYLWGSKGELGSIVMEKKSNNNGYLTYEYYNFSTATGEQVNDAEILEAYGMTVTSFYESVRFLLQGMMENDEYNENIPAGEIEKIIEKTLSDENVQKAKPFINADGELSFITGTYWVAGAGYYYHLMDMKGNFITITCDVHK